MNYDSDDSLEGTSDIPSPEYLAHNCERLLAVNGSSHPRLEDFCRYRTALLKQHMKCAAMQVYLNLLNTPDHPGLGWFEILLTFGEHVCSMEGTKRWLPLRRPNPSDSLQDSSINLPKLTELDKAEYRRILNQVGEWDREDHIYRATVAFLQEEHRSPRFLLDVEQEVIRLCERRVEQLESAVQTIEQWKFEEVRADFDKLYRRISTEVSQLKPRRVLDRVLSGIPVKPEELVTDIDILQLPKDQWPKRNPVNSLKHFVLASANVMDMEEHLKCTGIAATKDKWRRRSRHHRVQMAELASKAELLQLRGELDHRVRVRSEKRLSQLQEEEATLSLWLSQGYLHPPYGARLVSLQSELLMSTPEKLYQEVLQMSSPGATPRTRVKFNPEQVNDHV